MSWLLLLVVVFVVIGGGWWGLPLLATLFGAKNISDKEGALVNIAQLMQRFEITPAEVEDAFLNPSATPSAEHPQGGGEIAKTLFSYLGAIFIVAGISTYIGMFWTQMGAAMRIAVTLGVGYILLLVLISALHEKKHPKLILPLTLASVLMMTSGWFVLIHELFPRGDNWRLAAISVFGVMAIHQAALGYRYRLSVFVFTALFFGYGLLQLGLDLLDVPLALSAIILGSSLFMVANGLEKTVHSELAEPAFLIGSGWLYAGVFDAIASTTGSVNWAALLTGLCILCTAYGLQRAGRQLRLPGLGYLLGSIMAYTGLFDLLENTAFELLYFALTTSMLYACVVLKSRALLLTTVIAMLSYIGYFSVQYFVDSLGWPVTLILMGVAFMGVSALAIKVKRRI